MRRVLLSLLALCGSTVVVTAQSPWVRNKAGLYAQFAYHTIPTYQTLFAADGGEQTLERELTEHTFQLYSEYGLSARSTIFSAVPLRVLRAGEPVDPSLPSVTQSGTLTGLGNPFLGLRYAIKDGAMPLTATVQCALPLNRYQDASGLRTGYAAFTLTPMLSTGRGYGQAFWYAYAGYGLRTHGYSHVLNAGAEGGLQIGPVWAMLFADWVHPLRNGTIILPANNEITSLFVDNQGYLAIGFKSVVSLSRFTGAFLSVGGAASAQRVPRRPGIGIGAYFKWD
jgi:hypothetical protein